MTVGELEALIDEIAPRSLAAEWDNVGLLMGDPSAELGRSLFALDLNHSSISEAVQVGAGAICVHHPPIFTPMKTVVSSDPVGSLILRAAAEGVSVIAAHTNLDAAVGGVNDLLAQSLGIQESTPLLPSESEPRLKLVVFVPAEAVEAVRLALADAGCGRIGEYSSCSFSAPGRGSFLPSDSADPHVGERGRLSEVDESRLEMILPVSGVSAAIEAMIEAHPYEEVAYDIYRLHDLPSERSSVSGMGRVGEIGRAEELGSIVQRWGRGLGARSWRVSGDASRVISRVACCGGSGSSVLAAAGAAGADVLVAGELSYHDYLLAESIGVSLVTFGHDITEAPAMADLASRVQTLAGERGMNIDCVASADAPSSWQWGHERQGESD